MYDVIVVGAGPVGSYLAYRMASAGHDVVVLERREKTGTKSCCTGIVSRQCAESFPIDSAVILRQANSACLFSPSGKRLQAWRPDTQAVVVDRHAWDTTMAERARDKGARYVLNARVTGVQTRDGEVTVATAHAGDFTGRAAVIASGFGLGLTRRLGLGQVGDFVGGAQAVVTAGVAEVEVYFGQDVAPGFFAWLVPTLPEQALAGVLSRRSPGRYLRKFMASLKARGRIATDDVSISYGGVPLRPLPRTYADRLLVVGDAAGQVKPTTGGGIYYGLLGADIAVSTLDEALRTDNLSARHLARYEREWKRKLNRELALGYRARRFYERLSDRQIDNIFDIMQFCGIDRALAAAEDLHFDWHGEVLLRLLRDGVMARAMGLPLRAGRPAARH